MIPTLSLRGMLIMGGIGLLLVFLFLPRQRKGANDAAARDVRAMRFGSALNLQLFFLGAGFMLVETKAVVTMALLFGSTWVVNSVVFFAVLVMILIANRWTLRFQPERLWLYYAGLLITLILNTVINIAGAMVGGLAEYSSMLLGFQYLVLVAILFYTLSAIGLREADDAATEEASSDSVAAEV